MNRLWTHALRRIGVDLREREAAQVNVLFAYSFLLGIFQFSSKAVRQATYVDSLGAERLPFVYLAVALAAYPTLRLYGLFSSRWSSGSVIGFTVVGASFVNALFWRLFDTPSRVVSFGYYLWIAIAIALTLSQLWSYVNTVLDARQARRLFGFIGAGGLLGGVVGGQVASWAASTEPRHALLVGALVLLLIGALVRWSERTGRSQRVLLGGDEAEPRRSQAPAEDEDPGIATGRKAVASTQAGAQAATSGFEAIRRSAHLKLIATIMVLTVVVAEVVDLQFNWVVQELTTGLIERTALFGKLFSLMGLAAFLFQLLITGRIHRNLGVGFAMRVLPVFVLVLCALIGVADLLWPAMLVFVVSTLKIGDNGLRYSLDHATRELLFMPVQPGDRLLAKSYIDVLVHRAAKGLGALLLLTVTFGWLTVLQATWFTVVFGLVWLGTTVLAQRNYLTSLRAGLAPRVSTELVEDMGSLIDPQDVTTLEVLIESLGSTEPERVLHSLDLLAAHRRAHLVTPLLLHHDDARVRRRTLEVLAQANRRDALPMIERRIGDAEQDVRAAAIQAIAALSERDGPQLMEPRLSDPDPRVRAAAIGCLADQGDERQQALAEKALERLLSDEDKEVRAEAAKALSLVAEPTFQQHLVTLLYDRDSSVVAAAIAAVRERASVDHNPLYVPILISLLRDRRLQQEARETLFSYGERVLPALAHFMNDPGEYIWVRRALPKAIARFPSEVAAPTLYDSLDRCVDPFLRRKVIEALARCRTPGDRPTMERLIHDECRRYLETLVRLIGVADPSDYRLEGAAWRWRTGGSPGLLERLLDERRQVNLLNLERLLALYVGGRDIARAWRGLRSSDRQARGRALEYLDNSLTGATRRSVMTVVDDLRLTERLEMCARYFGIVSRTRAEVLRELVEEVNERDEGAPWLAAAAVHAIIHHKVRALASDVTRWASESTDPLVRETAGWAVQRVII